jgi:hypothetical protein
LALIGGGLIFSNDVLLQRQTQLQLQNFSPSINEKVYAVIKKDGPQTRILTNYPLRFLPGLEQNQITISFKDFERFIQHANDPTIRYLLISGAQLDPRIDEYIKSKISDGSYQVILVDKSWIKSTLLEVLRR